jgi:hypothetical protein
MATEATNGKEAREAVERSRRRLVEARSKGASARSIVERLTSHLQENHFSDRLDEAFGRERR